MRQKILFFWVCCFSPFVLFAQGWLTEENKFETNWNITFQTGSNMLLGEMKKDFSGMISDMDSYPGWGLNIQLSKMAWEGIDLGIELGFENINGINNNSSTINFLSKNILFNEGNKHFLPYPVVFNSNLYNLSFYYKYNFINFSSYYRSFFRLNMFMRLGLGLTFMNSSLGYKEYPNYNLSGITGPFFSSTNDLPIKKCFNGMLFSGIGMNYQVNTRIFLSAEMSFDFINSGLIDGTYNLNDQFNNTVPFKNINEYVIPVFSISGKLMIGCTYFFNFDTHRKIRMKAYPFYNNRYRSYFSKYQTPSSRRKIKERLPFYNNNFDK